MTYAYHYDTKEIKDGKFFAIISYLGFLCVAALVLKKDNKFTLYHARQGLVLFVFEVAALILLVVPVLGWIISNFGLAAFGLISLWNILQVLMGKYNRFPIISDIAKKIVV